MKTKELVKRLLDCPNDMEVVMYTPCGPGSIEKVMVNGCNQVVLDSGKCCEHIMDGECKEELDNENNMIEKAEVVDKWAVIVGMSHSSGDPSLHLHRIYEYKDKQYALNDLKYLKGTYKLAFI